ncbi:Clp protease ClpP [Roseibium sp.]|uniref:globin domain-containing protein n=1 Tax=Roseibium sp. TaxID=1936156 RepID=UPI003D0F0722
MTLYMKIGGRKAVLAAVPALKERLDADPCFDLSALRGEFDTSGDLCEFLVFLFGGAPFYDGKPVTDLLSPLCDCDDVYGRFVDHLVAVLLRNALSEENEAELRSLMERLRPHVLAPRPTAPVLVYSVDSDQLRA